MDIEQRMEQLENNLEENNKLLAQLLSKVNRIEVGLFGDVEMKYVGLMEQNERLAARVKVLEDEVSNKKNLIDGVTMWGRRIFWISASAFVVIKLLLGDIDIIDLLKFLH